ncbi:MAG: MotA/TolQ/ExbB proton channel family protein [Planctomycetota bacterium]|nr:MotA/TolQ/ExbB proton channel family protein [Planctomycetota bacterium]
MAFEISAREKKTRKKRSPRQTAIINAMETRMVLESDKLYSRLSYLNLIAVVAPLLGLLGTVMGIIVTLTTREVACCHPGPLDIPGGFQKALVSTLLGLSVAIPTKILYVILSNRAKRMALEVNLLAKGLMARFTDPE